MYLCWCSLLPGLECVSFVYAGGKSLKDDESLASLGLSKGGKLYFRDLGPQVGWTTVSLLILWLLSLCVWLVLVMELLEVGDN